MPTVSKNGRDSRIFRAAREVLLHYTLTPSSSEGEVRRIEVRGGTQAWVVTVHDAWRDPPHCTCPDASRDDSGGYCKHVIAVLLRDDVVRCQLLEVFL